MTNITVLGSNGMLGRYVSRYFEINLDYNVFRAGRDVIDASEATRFNAILSDYLDIHQEGDVVINCIGIIKPKVEESGPEEVWRVNSVFPHLLAYECKKRGIHLFHITTDCVFSGKKGRYIETDLHDADDRYGKSKSSGEPENCTVIRTSIIGEELGQSRSLVEWVKSQAGQETKGFTNHYWNGITCLELAKYIHQILKCQSRDDDVVHVFSPQSFSKYELVQLINARYNLGIKVIPTKVDQKCDRTLSSMFYEKTPHISPLPKQIAEMKEFDLR